jgi:hypothetical protein
MITMIPAAIGMIRLNPPIRSKVPERRMLRTTKTVLNPRIKLTVMGINRGLGAEASETPAAVSPGAVSLPAAMVLGGGPTVPPKKQSQEGMRGSTQGDRKENNPATKAKRIDTLTILKVYPIFPALV